MEKQKVLITGASKGIGKAVAEILAPHYSLVLHASVPENLPPAKEGISHLCADFSDPEQLSGFCNQLKKEHGESLYAVINNAGLTLDKSLIFQPEKDIDTLLQVNLKAPILICKTAFKLFNNKKAGVIINIGSCVGQTGNAFQAVYAATKAGLIALSKSLAKEAGALNPDGHQIRVLSISPGFIQTNMTDALPETAKEKYLSIIPSRRFGLPEEVAETVLFLLSTKASFTNGSNMEVNGGML
jgi:3-oxoacyl-[acyl-carrier protein] reductase